MSDAACACQFCAGHYWTCCTECGRDGDRSGDTNSPYLCEQEGEIVRAVAARIYRIGVMIRQRYGLL